MAALGELLLPLYLKQLVEISVAPARFQVTVPEFPQASPYARYQAEQGMVVTNLRHQRVELGALDHEVLRHLDGSRDRRSLAGVLEFALTTGRLTMRNAAGPVPVGDYTPALFCEVLECSLVSLAQQALLSPQTGPASRVEIESVR
jgi:hypothetical protein